MQTDLTPTADTLSTLEVARQLGMAVRSIQLMVDRGELDAWRTPGGHRRITKTSVDRWMTQRGRATGAGAGDVASESRHTMAMSAGAVAAREGSVALPSEAVRAPADPRRLASAPRRAQVLVIEDSKHYQNLIGLLLKSEFPGVDCVFADDGIVGLAMAGQLQPDVLLVDILLPGIDGATLITGLRGHSQFAASRLVVVTSLDEKALVPYQFALEGVPVVHKSRLVAELPDRLRQALQNRVQR